KAPNGHFYSNKAPGAVMLGLPMFALTDVLARRYDDRRRDVQGRLPYPRYVQQLIEMLWLQVVPFMMLVLWLVRRVQSVGTDGAAFHFFALAAFLGNTAAIYMNCNFGHGVASILFLAGFYAWYERQYLLTGAFVGFSLCCDYGVAFALPFVVVSTFWRE